MAILAAIGSAGSTERAQLLVLPQRSQAEADVGSIAAGLRGLNEGLAPADEFAGNIYDNDAAAEVPLNLRDAIAALERSAPMRSALGDDVVEHYLHAGRWEQSEYDRRITDFELKRHFERS